LPIEYSEQLFSQQGWSSTLMPTKEIGFEGLNKWSVFGDILKIISQLMLLVLL
jgi:hypothetical protein